MSNNLDKNSKKKFGSYLIKDEHNMFQKENNQTTAGSVIEKISTLLNNNQQSYLENLPNELFLLVMSYLSSSDVVQIFYDHNKRCNSIVIEYVRHFKLSNSTPLSWFAEYMPRIQNKIQTLSFDVKMFPRIYLSAPFYSNLRSVILKQSTCYTIELNVEHDSVLNVIVSSLSILRICSVQITNNVMHMIGIPRSTQIQLIEHCQNNAFRTLACSAIEGLSIGNCNEQDLLCLCALAPNLTNLTISQLNPGHNNFHYTDIADFISKPTRLTQLNITSNITSDNFAYLNSIERLIECYQSSLKQLTLFISSSHLIINGQCLEALLEPCTHLKKLSFAFQFKDDTFHIVEQLRQFESDWWLNNHQPPVLIHRNDSGDIFIGSMPCILPVRFSWSTNLDMWRLNKEQLDSPMIYFTRVKLLHFIKNNDCLVTLDFLHFINRIFRSCNQQLRLTHWKLALPHKLFEQLISTSMNALVLPKVKCLDIRSYDRDGLDAITLLVWLQLAPNVRQLLLKGLNNTAKMRLRKQINEMINMDARVNGILARLDKVSLF